MSDDPPRRPPLVTIVDAIASLPRTDVRLLIFALRSRLGVPEAPSDPRIGNPPSLSEAAWFVVLEEAGADPVGVMRLIRARTPLPLARVKDLVRSAPSTFEHRFNLCEAEELVAQLRAAGARARKCLDPAE